MSSIPLQASEAISKGLPVFTSKFTFDSFGGKMPDCVEPGNEAFARCIVDLHGDQLQWMAMQKDDIVYIKNKQNRQRNK